MYVKGPPEFGFGYTAILASIIITLAGGVLLAYPIVAAPAFMAALPVVVVLAAVGFVGAIERTEALVFSVFDDVPADADGLAAILTGQESVAVFVMAFLATIFGVAAGRNNGKFRTAVKTFLFDGLLLGFVGTLRRTETMLAAVTFPSEFLAALFARKDLVAIFNRAGLAATHRRTEPLRRAMGPEFLAAQLTSKYSHRLIPPTRPRAETLGVVFRFKFLATSFAYSFIHTLILTQLGAWVKIIKFNKLEEV